MPRYLRMLAQDSLAESDKITLETARYLKDDFLQQNSFTKYDKYCPFYKSTEMLKNIVAFHECALQVRPRPPPPSPTAAYRACSMMLSCCPVLCVMTAVHCRTKALSSIHWFVLSASTLTFFAGAPLRMILCCSLKYSIARVLALDWQALSAGPQRCACCSGGGAVVVGDQRRAEDHVQHHQVAAGRPHVQNHRAEVRGPR